MVVTLATGDCRSHPDCHRGVDPINDSDVAEFLVVRPPLVVGEGVAMKRSRNQLIVGRIGKQVASNLFDGELIEWLVLVQ